jgi:hypothetical protein
VQPGEAAHALPSLTIKTERTVLMAASDTTRQNVVKLQPSSNTERNNALVAAKPKPNISELARQTDKPYDESWPMAGSHPQHRRSK